MGRLRGLGWLLLLLLFTSAAAAQTAVEQQTMVVAQRLYENGRFLEAAQLYQQLVDGGLVDSSLFYNTATAYYRAGELGHAVLNFERAARLAPRDDDVVANLALARQQVGAPEPPLLDLLLADGRRWLTLNETAVLALLAWVVWWGLLWAQRRWRLPLWRGLAWATAAVCLLALLLLGGRLWVEQERPTAIVTTAQISAANSPLRPENDLFTLTAGTAVRIEIERPDWLLVARPGSDQAGWVPAAAIERIGLP